MNMYVYGSKGNPKRISIIASNIGHFALDSNNLIIFNKSLVRIMDTVFKTEQEAQDAFEHLYNYMESIQEIK